MRSIDRANIRSDDAGAIDRAREVAIGRSIGRSVEVAIERETDRPVRGRTHDAYIVHTVGVYACVMRVI